MEPVRTSLYDIVKKNLKIAKRRTFLFRYIYFGEYKNIPDTLPIHKVLANVISAINSDYCHEKLTGFMAIATNFFITFVEGSEDAINKHFINFYKEADELIGRSKLLTSIHHIHQRCFDVWATRFVEPSIYLDTIDKNLDFETIKSHIHRVIRKFVTFSIELRVETPDEPTTMAEITQKLNLLFPENAVIIFLLSTNYLMEIRDIIKTMNVLPIAEDYSEQIWPVRDDYVPYNIFKKEKDPIPYLPGLTEKKYLY